MHPAESASAQHPEGEKVALDNQEPHQAARPLVDPTVVTSRGCNPMIENRARAMGGDDPASAYAAAMLWYQGYPEAP
jgi:hypothetical protein